MNRRDTNRAVVFRRRSVRSFLRVAFCSAAAMKAVLALGLVSVILTTGLTIDSVSTVSFERGYREHSKTAPTIIAITAVITTT
jgi:hypothetical protein